MCLFAGSEYIKHPEKRANGWEKLTEALKTTDYIINQLHFNLKQRLKNFKNAIN